MMNKKWIPLVVCAGILVAGFSVKPAMAYFTDYASASGNVPIAVQDTHSTVEESGEGQQKIIVIDNDMDTQAFVRVRVILPDAITASVDANSSTDWYLDADGYYYYRNVLEGKSDATTDDSTSELILNIDTSNAVKTGENAYADFNVIVIPESAKVLYDAEGNAYADWNQDAIYSKGGSKS